MVGSGVSDLEYLKARMKKGPLEEEEEEEEEEDDEGIENSDSGLVESQIDGNDGRYPRPDLLIATFAFNRQQSATTLYIPSYH